MQKNKNCNEDDPNENKAFSPLKKINRERLMQREQLYLPSKLKLGRYIIILISCFDENLKDIFDADVEDDINMVCIFL